MKTCPNCGAQVPDEAEYCGNCGAFVGQAGPPVPPPLPQPPQQPYAAPGDVYAHQQQPGYPPPGYPPQGYGYPQAVPTVRYAGFWIRFLAYIIDYIVLGIIWIPIFIIYGTHDIWTTEHGVVRFHFGASWPLIFLIWAIYGLYGTLMIGSFGQTLGKMAVGVKVVRTDLTRVGYGTAALREIVGKWISGLICNIGYIWAGFDPHKQAWHDHICNTLVIYK